MDHMELARALRANEETHYNCCQSVLVTFAKEMGFTQEQAYALGSFFNAGMRHGSACGVLSGTLMVLGMTGCDEQQAAALLKQFRTCHCSTSCADLLKAARERGEERKPHCDALVYEMVEALDAILAQKQ